jgi:hypothetical protein
MARAEFVLRSNPAFEPAPPEGVHMRYMLLLYVTEREKSGTDEMLAFHRDVERRGVLLGSDPLYGPDTATTVRERDGKVLNIDGPFAETSEWLAGYFMLDCRDLDEALEIAALCPTAKYGSVEVRPLIELPQSYKDAASEVTTS